MNDTAKKDELLPTDEFKIVPDKILTLDARLNQNINGFAQSVGLWIHQEDMTSIGGRYNVYYSSNVIDSLTAQIKEKDELLGRSGIGLIKAKQLILNFESQLQAKDEEIERINQENKKLKFMVDEGLGFED